MSTIEAMKSLMAKADLAIIDNRAETFDEGSLYVKRGDNECLVAKPQCSEWARYLGALVKHGPALLAVASAAQELGLADTQDYSDEDRRVARALAKLEGK